MYLDRRPRNDRYHEKRFLSHGVDFLRESANRFGAERFQARRLHLSRNRRRNVFPINYSSAFRLSKNMQRIAKHSTVTLPWKYRKRSNSCRFRDTKAPILIGKRDDASFRSSRREMSSRHANAHFVDSSSNQVRNDRWKFPIEQERRSRSSGTLLFDESSRVVSRG